MKATSIEQIREHLARGGRVTSINQWMETCEARGVTGNADWVQVVCTSGPYKGASAHWRFHQFDWELLPIEEEKLPGTDAKTLPSEERKLDITQDEIVVGAYVNRIRQSLLFGHYPAMNDLLDWWQATTGERIEWGRRCNACECSGKARKHVGNAQSAMVNCKLCQGSGYTVRPTWMGEVKG